MFILSWSLYVSINICCGYPVNLCRRNCSEQHRDTEVFGTSCCCFPSYYRPSCCHHLLGDFCMSKSMIWHCLSSSLNTDGLQSIQDACSSDSIANYLVLKVCLLVLSPWMCLEKHLCFLISADAKTPFLTYINQWFDNIEAVVWDDNPWKWQMDLVSQNSRFVIFPILHNFEMGFSHQEPHSYPSEECQICHLSSYTSIHLMDECLRKTSCWDEYLKQLYQCVNHRIPKFGHFCTFFRTSNQPSQTGSIMTPQRAHIFLLYFVNSRDIL